MNESPKDLYIKVLTIAANEGLPHDIGENNIAPYHIFSELHDAGYLSGRQIKYLGGGQFANLKITLPGRF